MFKNFFKKIATFFVDLFSDDDTEIVVRPEDTIVSPPIIVIDEEVQERREKDLVNNGNGRNPDFTYLWDNAKLDADAVEDVKEVCAEIYDNKERYEAAAKLIGPVKYINEEPTYVPWWYIACLHYRESTLSFQGVLHNGQKILGTVRKTTWEPKGRGPFDTWEESAKDAMLLKKYNKYKDWDVISCLKRAEIYNGLGYRKRIGDSGYIEYSPYVWAYTNFHDEDSKYKYDGKYSKYHKEKQLGVASIMIGLRDFHDVDIY